jgi:hypothetical protein
MAEAVAASSREWAADRAAASGHAKVSEAAWKRLQERLSGEYLQKYRSAPLVMQYMKMGGLTK